MTIKKTKSFPTIPQRILYGLKFLYPDHPPDNSEKLHTLMAQIINKLYETPNFLNLNEHPDEAYEWFEVNNKKPELDKIYQSIFKSLFEFYKFLYMAALHGEINNGTLKISNVILKENKTSYKPIYNNLLNELGVSISKEKAELKITADTDILQDLKLLAKKVPVNIFPWMPYNLMGFILCSFTNDFNYVLARIDEANDLNGVLFELQKRCLENGYEQSIRSDIGASGYDFTITFKNKIGGFCLGYRPRKYQQFFFGTLNGIGEKAMLEDFENLDKDLQKHFISICKPCNDCLICTKGGKNKIFTININYDGKDYKLCPSFPCHEWETIDHELMDVLFKYHDLQEKYGTDWKK